MSSTASQANSSPQDTRDALSSGSQEKGSGINLNFFKNLSEKKTTREGNTPKRRGPKPDSKPALTRRQELNRQAQRTHRERKELYIKALEDEVLRLKELFSKVSRDKDKLAEENRLLKEAMAQHGLPFAGLARHDDSGSSPSVANAPSASGSSFAAGPRSAFTPPSVSSSQQQPISGDQFRSMTQQASTNRGADLEQTGIDFVLTLEKPCMAHTPYLLERASEPGGEPCGHALMASCPAGPISQAEGEGPPARRPLNKAELSVLMELSRKLNLDGEITPVMAWAMVMAHPRFSELEEGAFQRLEEELLTKVRCYGFGAVMEEFELRDAIEGVLCSHPDEMVY